MDLGKEFTTTSFLDQNNYLLHFKSLYQQINVDTTYYLGILSLWQIEIIIGNHNQTQSKDKRSWVMKSLQIYL